MKLLVALTVMLAGLAFANETAMKQNGDNEIQPMTGQEAAENTEVLQARPGGGRPGGRPGGQGGNPGFPGGQGERPGFPGGRPGFPGGEGERPGFPDEGFPGGRPGFPGGRPGFPGGRPGFPRPCRICPPLCRRCPFGNPFARCVILRPNTCFTCGAYRCVRNFGPFFVNEQEALVNSPPGFDQVINEEAELVL